MYKVGILGCSGNIGSIVLEETSKTEDNYIYAATRKKRNIIKKNNIQHKIFDIENKDKLNDFISKCQVVINCTGIKNANIINVCMENNVNYVDPSFFDLSETVELPKTKQNNCIIYSAGCNPGLTEVFIKYIDTEYSPHKLEIIFSGSGSMSKSAIEELLDISNEYKSSFRSFVRGNSIEKMETWEIKRKLNHLSGDVICIPVINQSFFKCINSTDIKTAYFYNTFKSEKIILKLIEAKSIIEKDEKIYRNYISELIGLFEEESVGYNSSFTNYYCIFSNGLNYKKRITLESKLDWNKLTAVVITEVINLLKHNKNLKHGIGEVWEMFDAYEIIKVFLRNGYIKISNIRI
ncbi:saccharopine dehydrogenase NADP-binding domain-containing protein [Finegoldia magna]|uniref:saccharopine dehydrogenase NADP-binding domain-containing protein n=1 Tax=Finegoldia magna TaxID=1260 RepID=UPI00290809C0|nr:saccharopine dehydrogenase NADP-binding domain-containing protein [Finegoldia magna]MDU6599159.1 saccharopine dehydrogenase NADP-binding domain-containing protein [Finegoldia magna]